MSSITKSIKRATEVLCSGPTEWVTENLERAAQCLSEQMEAAHLLEADIAKLTQTIADLRTELSAMTQQRDVALRHSATKTGKLDICKRLAELEGVEGDFTALANDYGGTDWEKDIACQAVLHLQRKYVAALTAAEARGAFKQGPVG